jgi:hypothetical protein
VRPWLLGGACALAACGNAVINGKTGDGGVAGSDSGDGSGSGTGTGPHVDAPVPPSCTGITCSGHGTCFDVGGTATCQCDGGYVRTDPTTCVAATGPTLGGCPVFPANNIFNTAIDGLPVLANSAAMIQTIGPTTKIHLDLGTTTNQQANDFYGIPYNLVHGASFTWPTVAFKAVDTADYHWDPRPESDCAVGAGHTLTQPCTAAKAPTPMLPLAAGVLVEGGVNSSADQLPDGDHHVLLVDVDTCMLWEAYHAYSPGAGVWNIFGAAAFDLKSNALRPRDWTSADAAGFPILALLLRAEEADTGAIHHALRFTIDTRSIRMSYVWPARHETDNGSGSTDLPPMGQLFRLKASHAVPANANTQTKAIITALKTYGMYLADGGSNMYVTGAPSASWADATFSAIQAIPASEFEAVDLSPITSHAGWNQDSGAVP